MTDEEKKKEMPSAVSDICPDACQCDDIEAVLQEKNDALLDLKDKLLRTMAEMENVRKRAAQDVKNASDYAIKKFALSVLEVADNLERAISSLPEDAPASFKEGIVMTLEHLKKTLALHDVKEASGKGTAFDPAIHHVVGQIDSDYPEGTVVEVLQKGYFIKDRPLREAMVMVAKPKAAPTAE